MLYHFCLIVVDSHNACVTASIELTVIDLLPLVFGAMRAGDKPKHDKNNYHLNFEQAEDNRFYL